MLIGENKTILVKGWGKGDMGELTDDLALIKMWFDWMSFHGDIQANLLLAVKTNPFQ